MKFSKSFGAEGVRLESLKELPSIIKRALQSSVTTVIDVPVSPEANIFPMVPAGASIKDMIWGEG